MKDQFLVFEYDSYYPAGGMCDLSDSFDTIEDVKEYIKNSRYEHFDVYDRINNITLEL